MGMQEAEHLLSLVNVLAIVSVKSPRANLVDD